MLVNVMQLDGGGGGVSLPAPPTLDTSTLGPDLSFALASGFGSGVNTTTLAGIMAASGMGGPKDTSNYIDTTSLTTQSPAQDPAIVSTTSGDTSSTTPIDYRDVNNYDLSLSNIASVGAAMRDAGLNTAGHVAKYTQPVSIPTIDNGQPLNADDPRNSAAFRQKYGRYPTKADYQAFEGKSLSDIGKPTTTLPAHQNWMWLPTTGWRAVWEAGYGPGAWGNSLTKINTGTADTSGVSSSGSGGSGVDVTAVTAAASDAAVTSYDITSVSAANGGAASVQDSASNFVNNDPTVPTLADAVPAPVYALDSPENLYIDPNSFTPIILTESVYIGGSATPSTFSSTVYSVDLKFTAVPGAVKYNYRISATI